jgi:hypothetical protein
MTGVAALAGELAALERIFDDALEVAMPNPVALRFTDLDLGFQGKRDLIFGLGLLEEGENEAALIAGLAHASLGRDPAFALDHLLREAWYYLRTSIDPAWQFDDPPDSFGPALAYIGTLVELRVAALTPPATLPSDAPEAGERRALLHSLR